MLISFIVIVLIFALLSRKVSEKSYEIGGRFSANHYLKPFFVVLSPSNLLFVFTNDAISPFAITQITQNNHEIQTFTPVRGRAPATAIWNRSEFRRC